MGRVAFLPLITKQFFVGLHSSLNLTAIEACLEKNEGYVHPNSLGKRKDIKPKFKKNDFVRITDLRKTFSIGKSTNWAYKLYEITEIIIGPIPSYPIDKVPERCNEASLKKTKSIMKEKKAFWHVLNQSAVDHHYSETLIYSLTPKHHHLYF